MPTTCTALESALASTRKLYACFYPPPASMLAASKLLCSATLIGLLSFWSVLALHDEFSPAEALLVQLLMNVIGSAANPVIYVHNPEGVVGNATLLLVLWWTGVSKQTLVLDHLNCLLLVLRAQLGSLNLRLRLLWPSSSSSRSSPPSLSIQ
jgi:hypothetical protein